MNQHPTPDRLQLCSTACHGILKGMAGSETPTTAHTAAGGDPALEALPGYEIQGELGRGGMGVVYLARQVQLDRLVALKVILSGTHAGPEQLARFRTEAEAIARLQHPNIVQIHEIGEHAGLPYFSMEYCSGGSLKHKQEGVPAPAREAARLVEILARAIHLAHGKGVVHRDLKPANVLLREDGTPKISDFGLAKKLDVQQAQTATGDVMGTPSYMSPEQAQGNSKQVGPAADLYALGAILYELLTGRPPFLAANPLDTILQVISREPVPVRQLQPRIPRDLETICLKCLQKEASRRYASALDLADDLGRFLNGEPIRARPIGLLERGYRWCRRHRALAGLSFLVATLLVVVSIVSLASYFLIRAANADLQVAKTRSERNADQARENFRLASASMKRTVSQIAEDPHLKDRGFFELRRQLLAPAVQFYSELVESKSDDKALEAERGKTYGLLGDVRGMLGETEQAARDYRAMQRVFLELVEKFPDDPANRLQLAIANRRLGGALLELGRSEESAAVLAQAGELVRDLVERYPDSAEYQHELFAFHFARGVQAHKALRFEESRQAFQQALDLRQDRKNFPPTRDTRDDLATVQMNLGVAYQNLNRYDKALSHVEASRELFEKLVAEVPSKPEYLIGLVNNWSNLCVAYTSLGQPGEAEKAKREALRLARLLVERFPTLPSCRALLAHSCHNLVNQSLLSERPQEASRLLQEATSLLAGLVAEFPRVPWFKVELGMHYVSRGSLCLNHDDASALNWADQAVQVLTQGNREAPGNPLVRHELAKAHLLRTISLLQLHRYDESQRASQRILPLDPTLLKDLGLTFRLQLLSLAIQQQLVPELALARNGKVVEAAAGANRLVETRLLGSLRAFAATNVLTGLGTVAVARELAGREGAVGVTLYNAACVLTRCSRNTARSDPNLAEAYAARAVLLLTRARDEGYFASPSEWKLLQSDDDLTILQRRKDFQDLLATVPRPGFVGPR